MLSCFEMVENKNENQLGHRVLFLISDLLLNSEGLRQNI